MGKMMPLKWIEQAEAREVCVIALSEAEPPPNSLAGSTFRTGSLLRWRSWLAAPECASGENASLGQVVPLRQVRRAEG
jgi:hypothetical protein